MINGIYQVCHQTVARDSGEEMVFYIVLKTLQVAVNIVGNVVSHYLLYAVGQAVGFDVAAV